MKLKKGFSLVELMVVVTIIMVLTVGGILYMNDFNTKQKIEATKSELVSALRLARNYALTKQLPPGVDEDMKYVRAEIDNNGIMTVYLNETGTTYFSKDIAPDGVGTSMTTNELWFAPYEGKLLKDNGAGTPIPVDVGGTVSIVISSNQDVATTAVVEISTTGIVNEK